jgi:hypothetical protein
MDKHLALDGPLNGRYIYPAEAERFGYELGIWPSVAGEQGERVYMQAVLAMEAERMIEEVDVHE